MRLPRGVIGVQGVEDPVSLVLDIKGFKTTCYAVAGAVGAEVHAVKSGLEKPTPNFHTATLRIRDRDVYVACNLFHPYVGFTLVDPLLNLAPTFVDVPEFEAEFRAQGYDPLSSRILSGLLSENDLEALGPFEIKDIEYWRPQCLGHAIFNHWD